MVDVSSTIEKPWKSIFSGNVALPASGAREVPVTENVMEYSTIRIIFNNMIVSNRKTFLDVEVEMLRIYGNEWYLPSLGGQSCACIINGVFKVAVQSTCNVIEVLVR